MANLNLTVVFGDWTMGSMEAWLPDYPDQGINYKRFLWEPDDESKRFVWGNYDNFEKIAVDNKGRRTTGGTFCEVVLPEEFFYPIFRWGNKNIQFIETDIWGNDTIFSERHKVLMNKIHSMKVQNDGYCKQVALLSQKLRDMRYKKLSESEEFIDVLEVYKKIGTRPIEKEDKKKKDEDE